MLSWMIDRASLSIPPGMALCKNTSSVTVEGCSLALLAVTTWPATENSLSTEALVAGMARYRRATWDKYGNSAACSFHHLRIGEWTPSLPSLNCAPAVSRYKSSSYHTNRQELGDRVYLYIWKNPKPTHTHTHTHTLTHTHTHHHPHLLVLFWVRVL